MANWSYGAMPSVDTVEQALRQRQFGEALNNVQSPNYFLNKMANRTFGQNGEALGQSVARGAAEHADDVLFNKARNAGINVSREAISEASKRAAEKAAGTAVSEAGISALLGTAGKTALRALPWVGGAMIASDALGAVGSAMRASKLHSMARDVVEGRADYNELSKNLNDDDVNELRQYIGKMQNISRNMQGGY